MFAALPGTSFLVSHKPDFKAMGTAFANQEGLLRDAT
jgi:hypothetical protein